MKVIHLLVTVVAAAITMAQDETHGSGVHPNMAIETSTSPSPASINGHGHHGLPILQNQHLEPQQRAYWEQYNTTTYLTAESPAKSFLYFHITLNVVAWVGVFPLALMLGVENSPFHLPVQTLHSAMVLLALLCLGIYGATAPPDLYPNNLYSKFSVALLFIIIVHWVAVAIRTLAHWAINKLNVVDNGADYVSVAGGRASDETEDEEFKERYVPFESRVQDRYISRLMQHDKVATVVQKLGTAGDIVYTLLDRPLFLIGFAYLLVGIATATGMGKEKKIFNIVAHFIKGGVFFLFGLVTLARYLGAFADCGMAWNVKPESSSPACSKSRVKTMETVEAGLIFIYGISNVFLEHLGNEDGTWSHKDLQHASIAFMYIGGGLCGLLVESAAVRRALAKVLNRNPDQQSTASFNPFPAFIVFWTGVLMSNHAQELPLSTEIHAQWGTLLCVAAVFRFLTYLVLQLTPSATEPMRPFTELITSFCLICGGLVFMESNSQTIEAMLYRGLDSMFTLNVNVGITALLMSWVMVVMFIKSLAHSR